MQWLSQSDYSIYITILMNSTNIYIKKISILFEIAELNELFISFRQDISKSY